MRAIAHTIGMAIVRVSTDLPLAAQRACALAQKTELFLFVVRPLLRVTGLPASFDPAATRPGTELEGRLWLLGVVPAWRHRLRIVELGETVLRTEEGGGPVRTWNHTLAFEPRGGEACRYTDRVEVRAGVATPLAWGVAQLLFRWRQARWRALARAIA